LFFDHNLAAIPCRYWLSTTCTQQYIYVNEETGEEEISFGDCPFLHDLPYVEPTQKIIDHWNDHSSDAQPFSYLNNSPVKVKPVEVSKSYNALEENESFPTLGGAVKKDNKVEFANNKYINNKKFSTIAAQKPALNTTFANIPQSAPSKANSSSGSGVVFSVVGSAWNASEYVSRNGNGAGGAADSRGGKGSLKVLSSDWVESGLF
jgi:hypothetical protein